MSAGSKPLLNGVFCYAILPFLAFHGLVALVSETERYSQISHEIIMYAPNQFCGFMALCIVGDIAVYSMLSDRLRHKQTLVDLALMLLCGGLAGLSLRGLYLACV